MILVTGINGMLGNAVLDQLLERGTRVRGFDLHAHPNPQVESIVGDIRNLSDVRLACDGVEGVIHLASLVDLHLGQPPRLYDINVTGVENLIAACREKQVPRLVYMSSAEVISGASPLRNADEETPYPRPHLTYYGITKEGAERRILAANDEQLATCAFRTFGIFGEGDRNFVGYLLKKTPGKQIPLMGDNKGLTNVVYAGNLAHALILALEQLHPGGSIAGNVFHITDHEPQSVQDFMLELLEPAGYKEANFHVNFRLAMFIARLLEFGYRLTKAERLAYPLFTRHQLLLGTRDYYLDSSKARNKLGYSPRFDRAEAIASTQTWLSHSILPK